jgi:hypothetical protein
MVPLAAMARPRWRDFLIWQTGEVVYFASIWYFLQQYGTDDKGLPEGWYVVAILVHIAATAYFAAMVVRDIVHPASDPVRTDGAPEHRDDPGGGVLDGAPDDRVLRLPWRHDIDIEPVMAGHVVAPEGVPHIDPHTRGGRHSV